VWLCGEDRIYRRGAEYAEKFKKPTLRVKQRREGWGTRHTLRASDHFVDMQREQMYFVPVSRPGYTAPQCESENPRSERDMPKKKPTAKRKKLRKGKKLEKQKPLYELAEVHISGYQTSGGS
jgi:hypothetical protein